MKSAPLEFCTGCGEPIKPHWTSCPMCQTPLQGELTSKSNLFLAPIQTEKTEKEVRHDLLWAGVAMICLAAAGFVGLVMSFIRGGRGLTSDEGKFGIGVIVFAAMVGGGLMGAARQKKGGAAKGALKGLMYSLGAIFLVMAIITLIAICLVIFLIVTCMTGFNK